jgi:hypothetical protein
VTKLKHIDIHQHWLRQEAAKGNFKLQWVSTDDMPANGLTKALSKQHYIKFLRHINIVNIEKLIKP